MPSLNLPEMPSEEREKRLQAILDTAVEGIITIDQRGVIDSFNRAAERIFGYDAREVVGSNVSVLMPSPFREQHDGYVSAYVRGGPAKVIGIGREVVGLRKDGSEVPLDLSISEVKMGSRRVFTGIVRDISERKRAERRLEDLARSLEEKNRDLETIVYVASHDLRSPLVNLQGFSAELARVCEALKSKLEQEEKAPIDRKELLELVGEEVPEAIAFIRSSVTKMDALLSGFLRFSRLGRAALKLDTVDVSKLVRSQLLAMNFQVQQARAQVEVQDLLPRCIADYTQLSQVFMNLIDNALKYQSASRPSRITISGRVEANQVVYSIEDNGIGIAPQHRARVFEIFHRLNPGSSEGDGLGLTIAQRAMERMQGRIWIGSKEGEGSVFHLRLPLADAGESDAK